MLRITPSRNAAGTAKYFQEALQKGDYYTQEENTLGKWGGKLKERLGLGGDVHQKDFVALCYNLKPKDGSKLNPRHKENRKVGYDFTFSASKSVSLLHSLTDDKRIVQAFEQSVEETMKELETDIRFQEGQGKQKQLSKSGEMVWASFTHNTARPVDGIPDPHLHRHCFVMNTTWNEKLKRFQAAEFSTIKRDGQYYEAAADSRFAHKMVELGYSIERRGLSWEVVGIEDTTLKKFSRRTEEIEKAAKQEKLKSGELSIKQKAKLGVMTRAKKLVTHNWEQLKSIWRSWLDKREAKLIDSAQHQKQVLPRPSTSFEVMQKAEAHCFERRSVIKENQLKSEMLKRSFGQLKPEDVKAEVDNAKYFRKSIKGQTHLTTAEAVNEEKQLLAYVRAGKGTRKPINATYIISNAILSDEQKQAVHHALKDRNDLTLISGKAGVGKTTLMKEVKKGVESTGMKFHAFAPTAAASRDVMAKEGFANANTVASLLSNPNTQKDIKNGYVWVDEGGLMSVKETNKLLSIAQKQNARLLLTGDSRQHHAISRGDAFRILEKEAGLKVANVSKIQRQRNNPRFKEVVALAANGKADKALHHLDMQGGVIESTQAKERINQLVDDYTQRIQLGQSCLIISPTHIEGNNVTQALRDKLKEMGKVEKEERSFIHYKTSHHTKEQKQDAFHYQSEKPMMVEFHQNAKGFTRGQRWQVNQDQQNDVRVKRGVMNKTLPLHHSDRFTLYREEELKLAVGDKIRITKNTQTKEGTRIHNGSVYQITGFTKQGDIRLHTGKSLDKKFGHVDYGYTQTSFSSQGATTDWVFMAMSDQSRGAMTQQQFYVSLSRARKGAKIYTHDKHELEHAVMRDGQRMTAREIAEHDETKMARHTKTQKSSPNHSPHQKRDYGKSHSL